LKEKKYPKQIKKNLVFHFKEQPCHKNVVDMRSTHEVISRASRKNLKKQKEREKKQRRRNGMSKKIFGSEP